MEMLAPTAAAAGTAATADIAATAATAGPGDIATPAPTIGRTAVGGMVAVGAGVGAVYGSTLRAWMRFVSTNPEFSWSGTILIVGAFTLAGAMAGLVAGGRRRGWRALLVVARVVGVIGSLPCFGAAGAVMLPTIVPGALALARSDWPRWARRAAGIVAGASTLMVVTGLRELGVWRAAAGSIAYWALVLVEIRLFAEFYRPSVAHLRRAWRILAATSAVAGTLGVALLTVGFATGD